MVVKAIGSGKFASEVLLIDFIAEEGSQSECNCCLDCMGNC